MVNTNKNVVDKNSTFYKEDDYLVVYCHFVYNLIGKKILVNKKFKDFYEDNLYNKKYESVLKKANMKLIPDEYFISIFVTLVFLFSIVILSIFLFIFINSAFLVFFFYIGILAVTGVGILMYNYPVILTKTRGAEIDAAIPYVLPYMKILSKEINLSKMIEIIDEFLIYKEIHSEFKKIKYYSNFLGYDIHSSIREAMLSCPSKQLSDIMNDLVTISNSGGDIYKYLERKLNNMNQEIDAIEQKNLDTLMIYSQIYVVLLLISPLFFTIMNSILNLIQFTSANASGTSNNTSTIVMLLILLPFAYMGFMMLIYYSKPLYSRLKPFK